ncbi:MAG: hypothetical protein ABID79_03145 [Elusimicrobiota bacterium]
MSTILDFMLSFVQLRQNEGILQKKEVEKMRKFLGLLLVFGMMAGTAFAVSPDTCMLTVTPGVTYSVAINTGGVITNFSTVNLNSNAEVFVGTATVDGNISCDLEFAASNAVGDVAPVVNWTLATSPGSNIYQLQIATGTAGVYGGPYGSLTNSQGNIDATIGTSNVSVGGTKQLWAKIHTPTSMTGGVDAYSITLSIYAAEKD